MLQYDKDMNIQTLKGFRDFLPKDVKKRQFVLETLKKVFESYGFEPLETPALEYEEVLTGKYGDEGEKLMYKFTDLGGRKVALRYDQTVPLARVVAQYQNELPIPFKRYQIQPVWRAENTQKGRYREFLQVDIDTVGSSSSLADAEIIACTLDSCRKLGLEAEIWVNDRTIFNELKLTKKQTRILDKLEKIGPQGIFKQWQEVGIKNPKETYNKILQSPSTARLNEIFKYLEAKNFKFQNDFKFVPNLARGLDYYTSTIYELKIKNGGLESIGGGGRYDNLIGTFANSGISAVGFSFGFDRLIEELSIKGLLQDQEKIKSFLVTTYPGYIDRSVKIAKELRDIGAKAEVYLEIDNEGNPPNYEKQIKYAVKKNIQSAVFIGPNEVKNGTVTLKDLKNKTQKEIKMEELSSLLDSKPKNI